MDIRNEVTQIITPLAVDTQVGGQAKSFIWEGWVKKLSAQTEVTVKALKRMGYFL